MTAHLPGWASRLPPLLPLLGFLLLAVLWVRGDEATYRAILSAAGMQQAYPPFLDMRAITSAVECAARGVDVMRENPCDELGRPHVYGALWLRLAALGVDRTAAVTLAIALDLAFLAGLFVLPRARRWPEAVVLALAFASPAVVFALERANNDLLVWLIALAAAWLLMRGPLCRALAYGLAALGTLLKFYPVLLLALLCRERLWRALAIGVPLVLALALAVAADTSAPLRRFRYVSYLTDAFGAQNIAQSLLADHAGAPWQKAAILGITAALGVYAVSLSVRMTRRFGLLTQVRALSEAEAWPALAGAVLLVGCFFAGPSIVYRGIHLLLVLPAILALWRDAPDTPSRLLFAGAAWVSVWCLWSEAALNHLLALTHGRERLAEAEIVILGALTGLRELAWWWLISVLITLAGCIGLASPAGMQLCRRLRIQLSG